jgi:alkylation response protein AidB-like acyl-CoA dehydrogenase
MDFNFSEEQKLLRQSIRDFLTKECPSTFVREMEEDEKGYTQAIWQGMANLGWMGLPSPEKYGGYGGDFLDLVIMMEEMGRVCLPGPFFSTVVLGGLTLLEGGNESQIMEFLPKIAKGEMILTLAHHEPDTTKYDPCFITVKALPKEQDYLIEGTKLFVPDAKVADYLICVTRTDGESLSEKGITLFLCDARSPGIKYTQLKTIARDKQYEVVFNKVKVPGKNVLGRLNEGWFTLEKVSQKAALAKCAEMVGGAQQVLDMALNYAKKRVQFEKLIGSFQAVQHHFANMLIDLESAKWITYKTAWKLNKGIPCKKEVAVAKAWVSEAYKHIASLGHQIFGGVGYMVDHDMTLYSRRAKAAEIAFGDADFHRGIVAQEIGL